MARNIPHSGSTSRAAGAHSAAKPGPAAETHAVRAQLAAQLGRAAEAVAARFLASHGLEILHRNFRRRLGEIDLVARDGNVLVIVEVRTRSTGKYGGSAASIDGRKRSRIVRTAHLLLRRHGQYAHMRVRFDVVLVFNALTEHPQVQWLKHAFLEY